MTKDITITKSFKNPSKEVNKWINAKNVEQKETLILVLLV